MAALLHSESRRLYSWWWDSHISPKNSKWLQDNLTEIDAKVKAMIKIINEDADSFARRAEMYYKKRPELMKLVEDFYRAYRALAERYDHATGELRLVHRTMAEAFPNQVPSMLSDDSPSSSEPPSPVNPHLVRAFFYPDTLYKESDIELSRKGLKQLNEMFQTGEAMLRKLRSEDKDSNLEQSSYLLSDENQSCKDEGELQSLKEALAKMEAERDAILVQYRDNLEKLSDLEKELNSAQSDAEELDKQASEAQSEIKALKESLLKLEAERDSSLDQYKWSSEKLALLETESQNLKQELSLYEAEKQEALIRYEQSVEKISALEEKLLLAEENAKRLHEQIDIAWSEIKPLKENLSRLSKEKEDAYLRYQQCLDTISNFQNELMEAKEDIKRLNSEVLSGSSKLKGVEDQCALLEKMNWSLKLEAEDLVRRIAEKDKELFEKHAELENLINCLQDEKSRFTQVEATLDSLQNLHCQSQEEQRALASELKHRLHMLKDMELCKQDLELEIRHLREENRQLNDQKLASSITERDMKHEISGLREIKEKLEDEVRRQAERNDALQLQVHRLKEEIEDLHKKYRDLLQQVQSTGIDPKCVGSVIKDLLDENSRLKEISTEEKAEKEALLKNLEISLSDVNGELESLKEKMKALQESCDVLSEEKSSLVAEKSALLSQLQMITETMQNLLEKNALLEDSLHGANTELEGLRVKSKSLEDVCKLLNNEKSDLQSERSRLISQLEFVEKKVESFETRFAKLEDKYAALEEDKDSTNNEVKELRISLGAEKQERERVVLASEVRLSGLEDHIRYLQEENKWRKKDFEEQLEKAVKTQVEIFVLQKLMQDMEEKNYTLVAECQKYVEAAKYSEKVISELESENMMHHVEAEFLLDRVDKIRRGICQVLSALEIDHESETEPEIFLPHIPDDINDIKRDLLEARDENDQLFVQNTVLSTALRQLISEGSEIAKQKDELLEQGKVEMEVLNLKQESLEKEYAVLQEEHLSVIKANRCLQDKLSKVEEERDILFEENSAAIFEAVSFSNESVFFKSACVQKALELERTSVEIHSLLEAYTDSENEARALKEKLDVKEAEHLQLRELIQELEEKNKELDASNDQLNQKKMELFEVEKRIKALQDANTKLHTTIEGLDVTHGNLERQIFELSEYKEYQEKEIVSLREANKSLETEVDLLNQEIEACNIREVILNSELHERSCEFELWEAEATSFYFDLQTSAVREALFENTVYELGGLCSDLEEVSIRRSNEIEQMKDKISFLESESEGLKSQLAAYVPAIASLKNHVASLELTPVLQTRLHLAGTPKEQVQELAVGDIIEQHPTGANKESSSELQDLQSRIATIENVLVAMKETEKLKSRTNLQPNKIIHDAESKTRNQHFKFSGSGPGTPEHRNATQMKDIPLDHVSESSSSSNRRRGSGRLDQMLELWETVETEKELGVDKIEVFENVTESKEGGNTKIVLERLASDARMLQILHNSVQELKRRIESNKKSDLTKVVEYERLGGQLQDIEDSVVQLVDVNNEQTKSIEERPLCSDSVDSEQARKEAERIGRLQLDVQKIEYVLVKLEDEKDNDSKRKSASLRNRTGIILRDFMYRRRSRKQKSRFCGCFRSSRNEVSGNLT